MVLGTSFRTNPCAAGSSQSLFRPHSRTRAGKADAKQRDGGLQLQTAQAGQHHNGNTHGQGHGLENDRNDLTN